MCHISISLNESDLSYENAVGDTAVSVAEDNCHDRVLNLLRKELSQEPI